MNGPRKSWPSGRAPGFSPSVRTPPRPQVSPPGVLSAFVSTTRPVSSSCCGPGAVSLLSLECTIALECPVPVSPVPLPSSPKSRLSGVSSRKPGPLSRLAGHGLGSSSQCARRRAQSGAEASQAGSFSSQRDRWPLGTSLPPET